MKDSWHKTDFACACWRGQKEESFWHGIKILVVAHITLHPLVHILKYEMDFFLNFWGREKLKTRRVSHTHVEASHLSAFWRVLLIKYFQIKTIFLL